MILKYKNLNDYSFTNDDKQDDGYKHYSLATFVKKFYLVRFVKKPTIIKKTLYNVASIKLVYGVVFNNDTIYLENDTTFHPLIKKTTIQYLKRVNSICAFDKSLSNYVCNKETPSQISLELIALIKALKTLVDLDYDVIEMSTANTIAYIWDNNIYNPKNVALSETISLNCLIDDKTLIEKTTGKQFDLSSNYDHKVCGISKSNDKKSNAVCLKMFYVICLKNKKRLYIYRDIVKKTLTVNMVAKYLAYLNTLIEFDKKISSIVRQSSSDKDVSLKLCELKSFLESFEGYSPEDKKYDKLYEKRVAGGHATGLFMLWDEIWGD